MTRHSIFSRRDFVKTAGCGALAALTASIHNAGAGQSPARKPNIIFILADDLGTNDLGCYGQTQIQTPNIDRLAKEGVRFTDCYAGSTVCAPSRCSLMTGMHMGHAEIRGNKNHPLLPENVTVAEVLKQAGYTTGIIGKWGLGDEGTVGIPNRQGFDYWFGYLDQSKAHNYYPEYLWRNEELIEIKPWTYSHDLFAEESLKFVEKNYNNPFFLYLTYTIPHAFNEGKEQGMQVPSDAPYSDKDWPQNEKNFAAMITRMDKDIGRLMKRLQELGIDENTVVFFSSDNGAHKEGGHDPDFFDSNGQYRGIKRDLYEGGIRTPMIVRWPGAVEAGRVSNQVWAFWDFLPTAAEIAGMGAPQEIDGISMLPAILGQPQQDHEFLYWEFHERGFTQSVRKGEWKAVRNVRDKPVELYNLHDDPGETKNLAEQFPDRVKELQQIMQEARTDNPNYRIE